MDKTKILLALGLVAFGILFLCTHVQASSKEPWFNRKVEVPEAAACTSVPFDGAAWPLSTMYLSVISEEPVWMVIYSGQRYIRENIAARQRVVFNFVNAYGFSIEVCRRNFQSLRMQDTTAAKANNANTTTNQNAAKFTVYITSN